MHIEYDEILPIDGRVFTTTSGTWTAAVSTYPVPTQDDTALLYEIEFRGPSVQRLRLWVPREIGVENRQQEVFDKVQLWLEGHDEDEGIRACF